MTTNFGKMLATLAAAAALSSLGSPPARAKDYPGPYVGDTGFTLDQILRYDPVTNPYGRREAEPARPYFPTRPAYLRPAPVPAAPASYYDDTPTPTSAPSASYSYGAYAPAAAAHVRMMVPTGARVWFDGAATRQTGSVRDFESPALTPGKAYVYRVKAQWTEDGKEVTRTRQVEVSAGHSVTVDFTRP